MTAPFARIVDAPEGQYLLELHSDPSGTPCLRLRGPAADGAGLEAVLPVGVVPGDDPWWAAREVMAQMTLSDARDLWDDVCCAAPEARGRLYRESIQ